MKKEKTLKMLCVLVLAFSGALWAGIASEVSGTVQLEWGSLLPGVTVIADSSALTQRLTALSGEDGVFRFKDLPGGEYSFKFKLEGMKTILLKGIKVGSDKKVKLNAKMKFAALREELVVTGVRSPKVEKKPPRKRSKPQDGGMASVASPKLIKRKTPEYPKEAVEQGFEDDVVIDAVINETGKLTAMKVKKGKYASLITAAVESLKHWEYKPMKMNGAPVSAYVSIQVKFRLKDKK